jgi:hypothetical protein
VLATLRLLRGAAAWALAAIAALLVLSPTITGGSWLSEVARDVQDGPVVPILATIAVFLGLNSSIRRLQVR